MNKNKLIGTALITIGLLVLVASVYAVVTSLTIPNTGQISMIKAFWNDNATIKVQEFTWGDIFPESTQTQTFWLKNFGGAPVIITFLTGNWTPSNAADYMQVTLDGPNEISSGMIVQYTITLTVFKNATDLEITTPFSFNAVFNEAW